MNKMMRALILAVAFASFASSIPARAGESSLTFIIEDALRDKIQGAWTGMLIGGLEGLAHEFKYIAQPRETLPDFSPSIAGGARSDDDNDFELTHLYFMDKLGVLKIPYEQIVDIWKTNMNDGIWCANKEARALMDEGVVPPATGDPARNSFASFNLSGQFAVEMYGAVSPGMPSAACDLGLHYASIAVSGEPLQAARYWTSLVSLAALHTGPIEDVITVALNATNPKSAHAEVVRDAIRVYHDHPGDWKAARQVIYNRWLIDRKWNQNSTPSNGGLVILALLFGQEDFYRTLQYAMAMGLDADCNAATAGAVLGMKNGYKQFAALPGFDLSDTYTNKTRPGLPRVMKISDQVDLFMRVCERTVLANGGRREVVGGTPGYQIARHQPSSD